MSEKKQCSGVNLSGYWKGHPCGAWAVYTHEGKPYCANHYPPLIEQRGRAIICTYLSGESGKKI